MDVVADLSTDVDASTLFAVVADLGTYAEWLDIVGRVEPAEADADDPGPAWLVDLRAQLGPLRRSKRLRMVRTLCEEPSHVRFERRDLDGRSHSDWVLDATVHDATVTDVLDERGRGSGPGPSPTSTLEMRLHYGGSLWVPMLDRLLADEIRSSRTRLIALVGSGS